MIYRVKKLISKVINRMDTIINGYYAPIRYKKVINRIKKTGTKKIRFGAYVVFDSTFGMPEAFSMMIEDGNKWDAKIVVIPDTARGIDHAIEQYNNTKIFFVEKYGIDYVLDGWNCENNEFYDLTDRFDIIYHANPYDNMVNHIHSIAHTYEKSVLPIYISYGYDVSSVYTRQRSRSKELNVVWKYFTDTVFSYDEIIRLQLIKGKNLSLLGYAKMDSFNNNSCNNERKKVLISLHHTINNEALPLSNFLELKEFICELPHLYPEIDFVFRPHPLLFTSMVNEKIWTQNDVRNYIRTLQSNGIMYSYGGDYLKLFSECDAIINDCGSFTVEWMFTGKPACFIYSRRLNSKQLTNLMNKCIERQYIAHNKEDILEFINDSVVNNYPEITKMSDWTRNNIAINYPDVSKKLLEDLYFLED